MSSNLVSIIIFDFLLLFYTIDFLIKKSKAFDSSNGDFIKIYSLSDSKSKFAFDVTFATLLTIAMQSILFFISFSYFFILCFSLV